MGRKEFLLQSSNIFQLADNEDIELYATALTFANALYVSRKELGKETALQKLKDFHDILKTDPMDDNELSKALLMDDKDFEGNLQYCSAVSAGCERNIKDFPVDGEVKAMLPGDFLDSLVEDSVDEGEEEVDDEVDENE